MATKKSLDLTDLFYKKSETRTRTEITNEIAEAIRNLTIFDYAESFNQLPTGGNIRPNKIYIVPNSGSIVQRNRYDFYMYFDNQWEQMDALPFDIEDYVKIEDIVDNLLSNDADKALSANQGRILKALIDSKVDKVSGKGLSSNDFTNSYKSALDNLDSNLNAKVDKVAGKGLSEADFTNSEKTKLAGIATGATRVIVDNQLNCSSTNPLQNKVICEEFYTKDDILDLLNNIQTAQGKLLSISIDEETGDLIVDDDGFQYYTQDEVDEGFTIDVQKQSTAEAGYLTTYVIKQGGVNVGTKINIPKDFLIKSASINTSNADNTPIPGIMKGDKYFDFVLNTRDSSASDEHLYLNAKDLVDSYSADETTLTMDSNNVFSIKSVPTAKITGVLPANQVTHQDISGKVDKVTGKGLSSNDFTDADKNKLDKSLCVGFGTLGGTTSKFTVSISGVTLTHGTLITVYNAVGANAANATLNVNSLGEKPLYYNSTAIAASRLPNKSTVMLLYNTSIVSTGCWQLVYSYDSNTTYTAESTATNIKMNGTQSTGSLTTYARGDHVHPTDTSRAASSHAHGNVTSDGKIGTTANLPVVTGTGGAVTTGSFEATASNIKMNGTQSVGSANTFARGDHVHPVDTSRAASSHAHGSITNDGKVGSAANKPLITSTNGAVAAGSFGSSTSTSATEFVACSDSRLSDSRTPLFNHIGATSSSTKDLNNYTTGGFYYCNADSTEAPYISNQPWTTGQKSFFLLVETWGASNNNYVKQTLTYYSTGQTYVRTKASSSWWNSWIEITKDTNTTYTAESTATNIKMNGTQSAGSLSTYARGDHVHPSDTSKISTSAIKNDLTSGGASNVLSAEQGKALKTQIDNIISGVTATDHNHDGSYIKTGTGTVTSTNIADGTIVNGDIANTTITGAKLANSTITATQLASNSVTTAKITDANVTNAKFADASNVVTEYIIGTHGTTATSTWTGTSTKITSLQAGQVIFFKMTSAGTSTAVTLNLTLANGTTTGAKNVMYNATTNLAAHFPINTILELVYDGTYWLCTAIQNTNNYDRVSSCGQVVNGESAQVNAYTLICGKSDKKYYKIASGVVFDIRYPILWLAANLASGGNTNNVYGIYNTVNLQNTISGKTVTNLQEVYVEGTSFSNGQFTISSNVFVSDDSLISGRYYIPIGQAYSTTNIRFVTSNKVFYYNETNLIPCDNETVRYNGKYINGAVTVTKPYLRLFHIASSNGSSSSSHLIFEIIGNNNDRLYAKIRVDMRQNTVGSSGTASSYTVTPLEVYGFDLNQLYFGFYDNHVNSQTCLDIYRKVGVYTNFYIRIADDHLRNGSYEMYAPIVNGTESYTDLNEASTALYNASYTSTSQGGTYTEVTNTIPYTNINANKFVKRGGTSSQFLKADGSVDSNSYALSSHLDEKMNINDYSTVTLSVEFEDGTSGSYSLVYRS